uniref:50S ribosomal protein L35 n=1 Tax=Callithamnion tetricum TaxID=193179 RepID=A0A4D6WR86_9FLOR|nr:ribosomal protein L35 [Callithamnion tetricum]
MYKLKTKRSLRKRFKITGTGKILRHKASHNHLLEKKTSRRKQKLRKQCIVTKQDVMSFYSALPYLY